MGLIDEAIFIEYEQLPVPIISFDSHVNVNYLNSEAKDILKKINMFEYSYENKTAIPIWLNIKTQEFIKSECKRQEFIKKIVAKETHYFLQLIYKKILDTENNCNEIKLIINDVTVHLEAMEEMQKKSKEMRNLFEEQLVKLEKINSLSILAAGIAHDFNNILAIILGNIYIIKRYLNISTNKVYNKINNKFSQIEKLTLQAQDLNQQLMNFSKEGVPIKKNIYIKKLIRKTANMVLSGSNNMCNFSIAQDLWPVKVDEGQIRQVINNLLINAKQAMQNGGNIEVSANNVYVDEKNKNNIKQGKYIMIRIKDKGKGIPKENIEKIFEPYFTTKDDGTGLGLAASYSIITKHNGYIYAESELAVGTSFYVYLRASEEEVNIDKIKCEKVIQGTGKVLVMDDDKNIREINRLMLMELGYAVEMAKNGEEAIKAYKNSIMQNSTFDAVIIDLTIRGGMGGKETIAALLELDTNVNAILVSGYSSNSVMDNCTNYGFKECIRKPYTIEHLANVIYRVINKTK
ncbi:ATP-binding protein [Clostridium sp. CF012]|uniref:hybrid sensor histidine kinase/response regulator n=1 Tax=Clostridium sp. CF012 TaxID=2843319 RepID=UPI001C0CECDD|nr:ATP-binding protein [Clostridium sp. CF012]MBU3144527.1 response regulator [Clostridium sp. CF012]